MKCQALNYEVLSKAPMGEPSIVIRERVIKARKNQEKRFLGNKSVHCNAQMTEKLIRQFINLNKESLAPL